MTVLTLHAGAVVAGDRLVEALWTGSPPRTAAKTLQNYVLRLRRRFDDCGGRRDRQAPAGLCAGGAHRRRSGGACAGRGRSAVGRAGRARCGDRELARGARALARSGARGVRGLEEIAARHGTFIATAAHAGDGSLHPLLVTPKGDEAAKERSQAAFAEIVNVAIDMGGTVSGEHGVGILKLDGMRRELGPVAVGMHRAVKQALEPLGILNPAR